MALIEGYKLRKSIREQEKAYFTSWLLAPHVKHPIAPKTIYEPLQETEKKTHDALLDDKKYFEKMLGGGQ